MGRVVKKLHWPTAAVCCTAIVAVAATAILGPLTGLDAETLRMVLGGEGVLGVAVASLLRPMLGGGQ